MSWRKFVHCLLAASLFLLILSWWEQDALPPVAKLRAELNTEPLQTPINMPPFQTKVSGIEYTVKPLFNYEVYGLVVSRHDSAAWWDYIHAEWNDKLNIADLCVVWGTNANPDIYDKIQFSSAQFFCYYDTRSQGAYEAFDPSQLSNNHMLADNPQLAKALRGIRVGDQIHFKGYLSEYSHNHGFEFKRGTSTLRTDTGNGACETVFVTDIELIQAGGGMWRAMKRVAGALLALSLVLWWRLPLSATD